MSRFTSRGGRQGMMAAALLIALPSIALAQGSAGSAGSGSSATHGQRAVSKDTQDFNRHFQMISDSLKLSEEQSPKVREIFESEMLKIRQIKTKYKGSEDTPENRAEIKKELEELRAETHTQLAQVLSNAQMTKLQKMQEEEEQKLKDKQKNAKDVKSDDQGGSKGP